MTAKEKKLFALGVGAGVLSAALVVGFLTAREMRSVSAASNAASPVAVTRSDSGQVAEQGTAPGTTVELTPAEITAAGVQVAEVRTAALKTDIAAFGRVEQPEAQLASVSARIGGRVDKLYVQYTGERVRSGQPVAEIYSPEVATAIEEYHLAEENRSQLKQSDDGFARTQAEEEAANVKANELLKNSPYKDQLTTAKLFIDALDNRQKDIPNLISPHLGDRVPANVTVVAMGTSAPTSTPTASVTAAADSKTPQIVALPLGGRIKMDPWSDKLEMLKAKPVGTVAEREKMPFEVTPFMLYLTRQVSTAATASPRPESADSKSVADDKGPQR